MAVVRLAYGKAASVGGLFIPNVTCWPIASFRCAAEVGRYGGISIYENASSADVLPNLQLQPRIFSHPILNRCGRAVPALTHALGRTRCAKALNRHSLKSFDQLISAKE